MGSRTQAIFDRSIFSSEQRRGKLPGNQELTRPLQRRETVQNDPYIRWSSRLVRRLAECSRNGENHTRADRSKTHSNCSQKPKLG